MANATTIKIKDTMAVKATLHSILRVVVSIKALQTRQTIPTARQMASPDLPPTPSLAKLKRMMS